MIHDFIDDYLVVEGETVSPSWSKGRRVQPRSGRFRGTGAWRLFDDPGVKDSVTRGAKEIKFVARDRLKAQGAVGDGVISTARDAGSGWESKCVTGRAVALDDIASERNCIGSIVDQLQPKAGVRGGGKFIKRERQRGGWRCGGEIIASSLDSGRMSGDL